MGAFQCPDLQIEYEMPDQTMARVNLELTTTTIGHANLPTKHGLDSRSTATAMTLRTCAGF